MIELKRISRENVLSLLKKNGTRAGIITSVKRRLQGKTIEVGTDESEKFTIVKIGKRYGVSKRCTYGRNEDSYIQERAITLGTLRALGFSQE